MSKIRVAGDPLVTLYPSDSIVKELDILDTARSSVVHDKYNPRVKRSKGL